MEVKKIKIKTKKNMHHKSFFSSKLNYFLEFIFDFILLFSLLAYTILKFEFTGIEIVISIFAGALIWTLVEYLFHYYIFHKSNFLVFRKGHAKHHNEPKGFDSLPFLFVPLFVFLPIFAMLSLILPFSLSLLVTSIVIVGYIYYGLFHFTIHHIDINNVVFIKLRNHHAMHHKKPSTNFGVTTPLWDIVFKTR